MYRSYEKGGFTRVLDTVDFYCCAVYDTLWGSAIRRWSDCRGWSWHQKLAYSLAQYLPASPHAIKFAILRPLKFLPMQRRIKKLEEELLGSEPME